MSVEPDADDGRTAEDFRACHSALSNAEPEIRNSEDHTIPEPLFERVARVLVSAFGGTALHPERRTRITVQHTEADGICVKVRMFVKRTPNVINYIGNSYDNVVFMGAALPDADKEAGSRKIPDGWMRVKWRFYEPEGEAFEDDDGKHLPLLED